MSDFLLRKGSKLHFAGKLLSFNLHCFLNPITVRLWRVYRAVCERLLFVSVGGVFS